MGHRPVLNVPLLACGIAANTPPCRGFFQNYCRHLPPTAPPRRIEPSPLMAFSVGATISQGTGKIWRDFNLHLAAIGRAHPLGTSAAA